MSTVRGRRLRKALRRSTEALPAQLDVAALLPVADAAIPARLKRREAVFRRLLAVGDVLAIAGVLGLLDATRGLGMLSPARFETMNENELQKDFTT